MLFRSGGAASQYNCASQNLTVAVRVEGAGSYSGTCTGSDGAYSVSGVTINAAGDTVTIFIDGTVIAAAVTRASDTTSNIGVDLYSNAVVARHEDAGPITSASFSVYDSDNYNNRVPFTANGTLVVDNGIKLFVPSGYTFTPGVDVTTNALFVQGTFNQGATTLTLNGGGTNTSCSTATGTMIPLCVSGTFNVGTGTTNFAGNAATTLTTITYYNLTLNQSGTTFTLGGATTVSNDLPLLRVR